MMRANSLMVLLGLSLVLVSCAGGKSMTGTPATAQRRRDLGVSRRFQQRRRHDWNWSGPAGGNGSGRWHEWAQRECLGHGVNQITLVCMDSSTGDLASFGGNCMGQSGNCSGAGVNSLSGTADSTGGPFNFTYSEKRHGPHLSDLLCWASGRPDSDSVREPSSLRCRASGGFGLDTAESKVENDRRFTGFLPHTSWFPGQYS